MSSTITDIEAVRAEGALKAPSDAAGAATDRQIESAIQSAKRRMLEKIDAATYALVRDYSDTDLTDQTKLDQYDAFLHAESCFAIARLVLKLGAQQLSDTGLIQSVEIGKSRQSFASIDEGKKLVARWEAEGSRWLSPYLAVPVDSETQVPTSFSSKSGSFHVGGI